MYPGNIQDSGLKKFQSLNNIIKQSYNMMLIPIYDPQDSSVRDYVKSLLRTEIDR
jgi:hypothetical protein